MTGPELRAKRYAAGLSVRKLAARLGMSYTNISKFENERNKTMHPFLLARVIAEIDAYKSEQQQSFQPQKRAA